MLPWVSIRRTAIFMSFFSFATFGIGSAPSAAAAGILSVLLFAIVGYIAGPNLEKFDVENKD